MIVNLTPHAIVVNGHTFPPCGIVARVEQTVSELLETVEVNGVQIPIYSTGKLHDVVGLPTPDGETRYIVSLAVGEALKGTGRHDLLTPGTGPHDSPVRDERGQIVAVTRLKQVTP